MNRTNRRGILGALAGGGFLWTGKTPSLSWTHGAALAASGRVATIAIAANDSYAQNKAQADIVCTGTADQTLINAQIATLTNGGTVRFLGGTYNLTAPIVIDHDWVTLQGEGKNWWNKYNGPYPTHSTRGSPGGTQINQATAGTAAITVGTTVANMHGDNRHKGLAIRDLYLYSINQSGTGILDTNDTDISEVTGCQIQGFANGIDVFWDTPIIRHNSVQDCNGFGIRVTNNYGVVEGNICFDLTGPAIWIDGPRVQVFGNTIGDVILDGIAITNTGGVTVIGNIINSVGGNGIIMNQNGGIFPVRGVVSSNTIEMTGISTPNPANNTTGYGIWCGSTTAVSQFVISGNVVSNVSSVASTGFAIACSGTGATGNCITGNVINGTAWNSGGSNVVQGTGNIFANNAGQI